MAGFFSVRLAPGVRLSASSRGLRAHVGPRGARVHVGGGRTGVSTGAGPFTYYQSVGGTAARRPHHTGPTARQMAQADKAEQARLIVEQLRVVENLHRQSFAAPVKETAARPQLPAFGSLLHRAEVQHLRGTRFWRRAERRQARTRARADAETHARRLLAGAESSRVVAQQQIDDAWIALLDNDEDTLLVLLEKAFEDNEAPVAAVGVDGDEVSLVVLAPSTDVLPERMPSTTRAGNLSLRKMTKATRAAAYLSLVSGHLVVSVKEAFAVAPGLAAARVVVVRAEPGPGDGHVAPLMATRLTRSGLAGVPWDTASAWDVIAQTGTETRVNTKGAARELAPLDLRGEPALRELVDAVDLRELTAAT